MESRINKYNETSNMSRVAKHTKLYEEINDSVIDNFDVQSNATVIGEQKREIDIEQIKKILDKKYNERPQRRSIKIEPIKENIVTKEEDTKEYDLTKVLKKAKDENNETYEENRNKKLRNTQYDILNNLNIKKEVEEEKINPEDNLMNLINTITINEAKNVNPLDILTDLKGDDDTQVYESIETVTKTITEVKEKELDNSFYNDSDFKKKDFEEQEDFIEEDKLNIGIKILIVLVVVLLLVGIFFFLKSLIKF